MIWNPFFSWSSIITEEKCSRLCFRQVINYVTRDTGYDQWLPVDCVTRKNLTRLSNITNVSGRALSEQSVDRTILDWVENRSLFCWIIWCGNYLINLWFDIRPSSLLNHQYWVIHFYLKGRGYFPEVFQEIIAYFSRRLQVEAPAPGPCVNTGLPLFIVHALPPTPMFMHFQVPEDQQWLIVALSR